MKKALFLDLDDTLVNHTGAERIASNQFGQHYQNLIPHYKKESFEALWSQTAKEQFDRFLANEITYHEQRINRIRLIFQVPSMAEAKAWNLFSVYRQFYEDAWQPFSDVIPFLEKIRKEFDVLAVITDGAQEQQEFKLKKTGLSGYFNFVMTAETEKIAKPDPRFFQRACQRAGVEPDQAWYIGDNPYKDAQGANNAGMKGIWLNRNAASHEGNLPDITTLLDFTTMND